MSTQPPSDSENVIGLIHLISDLQRDPAFRQGLLNKLASSADVLAVLRDEYKFDEQMIAFAAGHDRLGLVGLLVVALHGWNAENPPAWTGRPVGGGRNEGAGVGWPGQEFQCIERLSVMTCKVNVATPVNVLGWNIGVGWRVAFRLGNVWKDFAPPVPAANDFAGRVEGVITVTLPTAGDWAVGLVESAGSHTWVDGSSLSQRFIVTP